MRSRMRFPWLVIVWGKMEVAGHPDVSNALCLGEALSAQAHVEFGCTLMTCNHSKGPK